MSNITDLKSSRAYLRKLARLLGVSEINKAALPWVESRYEYIDPATGIVIPGGTQAAIARARHYQRLDVSGDWDQIRIEATAKNRSWIRTWLRPSIRYDTTGTYHRGEETGSWEDRTGAWHVEHWMVTRDGGLYADLLGTQKMNKGRSKTPSRDRGKGVRTTQPVESSAWDELMVKWEYEPPPAIVADDFLMGPNGAQADSPWSQLTRSYPNEVDIRLTISGLLRIDSPGPDEGEIMPATRVAVVRRSSLENILISTWYGRYGNVATGAWGHDIGALFPSLGQLMVNARALLQVELGMLNIPGATNVPSAAAQRAYPVVYGATEASPTETSDGSEREQQIRTWRSEALRQYLNGLWMGYTDTPAAEPWVEIWQVTITPANARAMRE